MHGSPRKYDNFDKVQFISADPCETADQLHKARHEVLQRSNGRELRLCPSTGECVSGSSWEPKALWAVVNGGL
ncbi:hypothetical protein HO173_010388 [Letharia columbiana]|uniref:Uncharacterized protein n=1 Tax=Letharia columbiana TaxID=112416 RepID=A0A8H6FMT9_9LECA|nr:uncharacterized protein HO173_010388 [Letharia columbiana]KAF6231427.1 hypothetical protein HO173_010388 [Letharia columbiana]